MIARRALSMAVALTATLAASGAAARERVAIDDTASRSTDADEPRDGPSMRWHLDVSGGHFLSAFGAWQGREIGFGGAFGIGAELGLSRRLGLSFDLLGARFAAGDAPSDPGLARVESAGLAGGSLGLRTHPFADLRGLALFGGFGVVRTGAATRAMADAGLGWDFRVGPRTEIGPFVQYVQVFQPDAAALRPEDGRALFFGLHVAFDEGFGRPRPPSTIAPTPPKPIEPPPTKPEPPKPKEPDATPKPSPCPGKPADFRGAVDENGCPLVEVVGDTIVLSDKIYFELSSKIIEPQSFPILEEVARVILEHPEYLVVHIEGYTDTQGQPEWNPVLSQWRADAVKEKLVEYGVPASRLDAKGYGSAHPIASNDTDEGRAKNRRVEFHIQRRVAP